MNNINNNNYIIKNMQPHSTNNFYSTFDNQQQQFQEIQANKYNLEYLNNMYKYYNYGATNLGFEQQYLTSPLFGSSSHIFNQSNGFSSIKHNNYELSKKNNYNSSNLLMTSFDSNSSYSQQLEHNLNMLISSYNESPSKAQNFGSNGSLNHRLSSSKKPKSFRPIMNSNKSSQKNFNNNVDTNNYQTISTSSSFPYHSQTSNITSNMNFCKMDSFEDKLATTGNMFQKRDEWSIINKLPVNKQNTIHMRLDDEGPFGNDEIRCYLLSHFSSLNIKEIPCVFCDCMLTIYDRFPIIDGTLFLSPVSYDSTKSIPTQVDTKNSSHHKQSSTPEFIKKDKHKYINAVCMKCICNQKDHEIKCKYCNKTWQSQGGSNLQIGTLYKYDVFAAFPCCQPRLDCSNCSTHIINADSACHEYFSAFSDEKECHRCKTKGFHFVKPLNHVYIKSNCSGYIKISEDNISI